MYLKNILSGYLRKFVESDKSSPEAHTFYAEFLFRETTNVFSAHYQLTKAEADLLPTNMKIKKYILKKIIKQEVNPSSVGNKKYGYCLP